MQRLFHTIMVLWALTMLEGLVASPVLADGGGRVTGEITLTWEGNYPGPSGETWKLRDTATFKVCIQNRKTMVSNVRRELTFTGEQHRKSVDEETDCTPIHRTRWNLDIRRPGNWRTEDYDICFVLMPSEEAEKKFNKKLKSLVSLSGIDTERPKTPEEPRASEAYGGLPKGKYSIHAETVSLAAVAGYACTESHNVCTGITTTHETKYQPEEPGKQQFSKVDQGEHSFRALIISRYEKWELSHFWEIDYDPKGCSGSKPILQDKKQTISAKWRFDPVDPCQDARSLFTNIRIDLECYSDPTLIGLHSSLPVATSKEKIDLYEHAVELCIVPKQKAAGASEGEGSGAPINYGVDCNGPRFFVETNLGRKYFKPDEYNQFKKCLKDNYFQCYEDKVLEAVLEHEKKHMEQCNDRELTKLGQEDPVKCQSVEEKEAYCHEAKVAGDYLKENCKETNSDLEAIKKICGSQYK